VLYTIDAELPDDISAVRAVHVAAFPTSAEADLVDALRANHHATVSLVARVDNTVVGHVLFSPVTLERDGHVIARGVGLAPLAVLPAHQRVGIGAALSRAGLDECRRIGAPFCVVLGEPAYYQRFGFTRASDLGVDNEYGVRDELMILALAGALPSGSCLARYGDEFRTV
jgi:putative acetyltransferase